PLSTPAVKAQRKMPKGVQASKMKGGKEETIPEIDEILSVDFDRTRYPEVDVSRDMAISYLRREALVLPPSTPKGIVIITYRGLPLGPAKNIGSRANNLYPKNRRIRL
ncbi:MAG: hypothetical protein K2G69_01970, partial [Muribaculaceae bacterium]|nr:hypothetical protein [Muribaculaceae bacterium]